MLIARGKRFAHIIQTATTTVDQIGSNQNNLPPPGKDT